jgi:hypothetical protein
MSQAMKHALESFSESGHRRDGRAARDSTTILYYLRIYRWAPLLQLATMGWTGMLDYGQRHRIHLGRRTISGTTGRAGAADAAADSARVAVPSRDYGPDGAADGLSQSTLLQADDTTTRPSKERAEASVRCTGLGASAHYIQRGTGRV